MEFKVHCSRNSGVFKKNKVITCIAAAKCVPDFASSPMVVLSSSVPFFNHKNVVSLTIVNLKVEETFEKCVVNQFLQPMAIVIGTCY